MVVGRSGSTSCQAWVDGSLVVEDEVDDQPVNVEPQVVQRAADGGVDHAIGAVGTDDVAGGERAAQPSALPVGGLAAMTVT